MEGANTASDEHGEATATGVGVNPDDAADGEDDAVMPGDAAPNARASDASEGKGCGSRRRRRVAGGSGNSPGRLPKSVCCIIAELN